MSRKNVNWAPYLLLLPSFIYLLAFFGWPMIKSLELAFRRDSQILPLRVDPDNDADIVGYLERGTLVDTLDVIQSDTGGAAGGLLSRPQFWLKVSGVNTEGETVTGWAERGPIFVQDASRSDEGRVVGDIASVYAEADTGSDTVAELPQGTTVTIIDWQDRAAETVADGLLTRPVQWIQITAERDGETVQGWVQRGPVFIADATISAVGRVDSGQGAKEWTLDYVKRMLNDRNFTKALRTTVLLIVLILPLQFTLAIIMALVLQSRLRFNTTFLYIYSIPLGISDLAAGLVWFSVFTQNGFLNTTLQQLGLIDNPNVYISSESRHWIIIAIVLAEVWRATSIVMVIVVSGLQAIPGEVLEAGELFGANLWQRLRYIILPLLKPSLQVALILRTILAFQVFAVVVAISGGEVVTVLANETYRWYDIGSYNNPTVAAAYAGFIMLISLSVAVVYLRTIRGQEERVAR